MESGMKCRAKTRLSMGKKTNDLCISQKEFPSPTRSSNNIKKKVKVCNGFINFAAPLLG
jgi:hypothetical protein